MKILVIEDEPSMRELIQRALQKERFVVETAATFFDAEDKIELYDYDCVLLDIMLPDSFDLKLLYELLSLNKEARIVINSAINKPEITREALIAGARGFITKPFNEVDFLCKIKMALED